MVSAILKILVSVGKACSCIVVVVDGKLLKLTLVLFHFLLELVWPANIHLGGVRDFVCISKPKRKAVQSLEI